MADYGLQHRHFDPQCLHQGLLIARIAAPDKRLQPNVAPAAIRERQAADACWPGGSTTHAAWRQSRARASRSSPSWIRALRSRRSAFRRSKGRCPRSDVVPPRLVRVERQQVARLGVVQQRERLRLPFEGFPALRKVGHLEMCPAPAVFGHEIDFAGLGRTGCDPIAASAWLQVHQVLQ